MILARTSMARPVAMTTITLALLIFGGLAYRNLGLDLMPQVDMPYVTVLVPYPGAAPDDVESVARTVEDALSSVDGVKHMNTTCMNGVCQVLIEFELNRNVDLAAMDVRERIDLVRQDLPDAVEDPRILKFDVNARAVVTLALAGDRPLDELYELADRVLKDRFTTLSGVAQVELIGGAAREVQVRADRTALAARGLTSADLARALARGNRRIPAGEINEGHREMSVTFDGEAGSLEELGGIEVGTVRGERVYLRDVAEIRMGTERVRSRAFVDGRPCIALRIAKRGDANAVRVVERIRATVEHLRPDLPAGCELVWFHDDGEFIEATVDDAWSSIRLGIWLTGGILLLFLRDVRTALVAFVSLPVSIVISFMVLPWFGFTLNSPTLIALGISVGILVTNSIVVLENIVLKVSGTAPSAAGLRQTVERATAGVGLAVAASALTNIVVFIPIAMMKSLSGRFLAPFAVTLTAATLASLFISFTLTPILAWLFLRREWRFNAWMHHLLTPWERGQARMQDLYLRSLRLAGRRPLAGVLIILLGSVAMFRFVGPRVGTDFVPTPDQGLISARLEYPADFRLDVTAGRALELGRRLGGAAGATHMLVTVGKVQGMVGTVSEGPYLAEVFTRIPPKTERAETVLELMERQRKVLSGEADCRYAVNLPMIVGGAQQQIDIRIHGDDLARLDETGLEAARRMQASPRLRDVEHSVRVGRPEIVVTPNRAVLQDMGLSPGDLGMILRGNWEGIKASVFKQGDRSYDVRVKWAEEEGSAQVAAVGVPSPDGLPVALGAMAGLRERLQPAQINRSEKQRVVRLYANPARGVGLGTAMQELDALLRPILKPGQSLVFGGLSEQMRESFDEFVLVSLIAVALTYLLLAAMLESWSQPVLILLTVPFAYLGLFLALWVTGTTLSILGLLAGVMLVGVVVNNAILIMDEVNHLRRIGGLGRAEALWQAAGSKFRPIFMTSLAALLGMLPMAMGRGLGSEIRASVGIGSVGGMVVSGLLSLYVIPMVYLAAGSFKNRRPT